MIVIKPRAIDQCDIQDEAGQELVRVRCSSERGQYEVWLPTQVLEMARKESQYATDPDDKGPDVSIKNAVLIQKAGQWFMLSRAQAREMAVNLLRDLDETERQEKAWRL